MNMRSSVKKIRQTVIDEFKQSPHIDKWFLDEHLLIVERIARDLCQKHPEADEKAVLLGVWFHDIGRLRGIDEGHDLYGAQEAKKILAKGRLPPVFINKVYEVCLNHRAEANKPKSLEAKILATADASSHFIANIYPQVFEYYKNKVGETKARKIVKDKIERDYNDKIFFEEERKNIHEIYLKIKKSF
jgi:HD superfamily phosphodiesterase